MPKERVESLITDLHERFGDDLPSPQQQELMAQLQAHIHDLGEAEPVEPDFLEAVEVYLAEIEGEHPKAAAVVHQILDTLRNIGV